MEPQESNLGYASAKRMGLIGGNLLERAIWNKNLSSNSLFTLWSK